MLNGGWLTGVNLCKSTSWTYPKKSWGKTKKSVAPRQFPAIITTSTARCCEIQRNKTKDKQMTAKTDSTASTVASTPAPAPVIKPSKTVKPKTTKPAKTKAKPAKKNATKRGPGRPKANLKLILNKTFSMADMVALNAGSHELTVRRRMGELVKSGAFTKLAKKVNTGKRGKPADLFINTKVLAANRANLARVKAKADAVVGAEVAVNA